MKVISKILITFFLFFLCGCDSDVKYRYYTRINHDGTVFKRVVAIGDSASIYDNPFPFDVTNGWSVNYKKDTVHNEAKIDTVFFAIAEKTFKTMADVQLAFSHRIDSLQYENIVFEQQSKFRWFYTYNTYKETYLLGFPLRNIAIDQYMTTREQAFLINEDESVFEGMTEQQSEDFYNGCQQKWERCVGDNVLVEIFRSLDRYTDSLGVTPVSKPTRDSIAEIFSIDSVIHEDSWNSLFLYIDRFDNRKLATIANEVGIFNHIINVFKNNFKVDSFSKDYENVVEVNGLIYCTNGTVYKNNSVKWVFKESHFAYKDYVMEVNYRVANIWAFGVSSVIALGLIWILLFKKR